MRQVQEAHFLAGLFCKFASTVVVGSRSAIIGEFVWNSIWKICRIRLSRTQVNVVQ